VQDGGLAISISDPVQNSFWQQVASGWKWASGPNKGQPYDIKASFGERFDQAKANLNHLMHDMKNSLQGNDKFYFPVSNSGLSANLQPS